MQPDTKWPKRFMDLAHLTATWSKDPSRQIGAVVFNPKSHAILAQGYNGFARGTDDSMQKTCEREVRLRFTAHAEANAVFNAARHGVALEGMSIASTLYPCAACALAIVQSGIRQVYTYTPDWKNDRYALDFEATLQIFGQSDIDVVFLVAKVEV